MCSRLSSSRRESSHITKPARRSDLKKLKIDSSSNERDETESQKIKDDFSNSIQKIEEYGLDDRLNIQIINRYWSWLTFKINEENPLESTMSCSICKEHLNNLFVKDTNQFQGDVKIRQTKTENSRLLLDHQRSSGHLTTLRRLNKLKLTKTEEEINNDVASDTSDSTATNSSAGRRTPKIE